MPLVQRFLWLIIALVGAAVLAIITGLVMAAVTQSVERGLAAGGVAMVGCATIGIAAIVFLHGTGSKQ